MSDVKIELAELKPALTERGGVGLFERALRRVSGGDRLLPILGRYIQFNSVFGSGVANLSGEIGARQDLFRDLGEATQVAADRSADVAAEIFSAAIDEFGGCSAVRRSTHRTLAQATLKAAGEYFGLQRGALDDAVRVNGATRAAVEKVRDGYGINQSLDERKLMRAVGFHVGSELLADEEFRLLDGFLRDECPELVAYLERTKVGINGEACPAYLWISVHTTVEAEHFADALAGANTALRYYAGAHSRRQIKGWVLEGFAEFSAVQAEFMEGLAEN
jgi:hypothetical protein